MSYGHAVALSQRKRAEWERVFGVDRLPILDVRPRMAEFSEGPRWVYDVAVGRLHQGQVNRLAAHLARRNRMSYEEARSSVVRHGVTISADDVVVFRTADVGPRAGRSFVSGGRGRVMNYASSCGARLRVSPV